MPVLMVATYNEDGSINVMNAAWGTMQERDTVALNLTETHKTVSPRSCAHRHADRPAGLRRRIVIGIQRPLQCHRSRIYAFMELAKVY